MNDKETDEIICATDSGREGELIFRYIYSYVKCKKNFKRLWISSMTDEAILEGFKNLNDGSHYDLLYSSAKCRSHADWLVGINASRAYSLSYNSLLTIGRVQTPTLCLIVERNKEIENFVPQEYYEVINNYDNFNGKWFDEKTNDTKIFDKDKAFEIKKKVNQKEGLVLKISHEEKTKLPPLLYDLTELQRDCNKKFSFSAAKTLSIAQSLYETKKAITYPRTDSRYLSDDMKSKVKNILLSLKNIDEYLKPIDFLDLDSLKYTKRIFDNTKISDHHAIIPTGKKIDTSNFSEDEKKVFNLIAIRFISVFYNPYKYKTTKIITEVSNEKFISKGVTVIDKGYTILSNDNEEENDTQVLPNLKEGDPVFVISSKCEKKKTKPPLPYTEASLLSAMEHAGRNIEDEELKEKLKDMGLGTPATRALIIERLLASEYIVRKKKALIPTEKGIKLISVVPDELKSPITTGRWERGLSQITKGKMTEEKFMGSIIRYVNFLVEDSKNNKKDVIFPKTQKYTKNIKKPKTENKSTK